MTTEPTHAPAATTPTPSESPRALAERLSHWLVLRPHADFPDRYLITGNLPDYERAMIEAVIVDHPVRPAYVAIHTRAFAERNGPPGLRRTGLVPRDDVEIIADATRTVLIDPALAGDPRMLLAVYARAAVVEIGTGFATRRVRVNADTATWYVPDARAPTGEHVCSTLSAWYRASCDVHAHRTAIALAEEREATARTLALRWGYRGDEAVAQRCALAVYAARRAAASFAFTSGWAG